MCVCVLKRGVLGACLIYHARRIDRGHGRLMFSLAFPRAWFSEGWLWYLSGLYCREW